MKHMSVFGRCRNLRLAPTVGGVLLFGTAFLSTPIQLALSQSTVVVDIDVKEVAKGYRASELAGADVENSAGEPIGSIDDLIVDREEVLFAILQIGGFLGLGGFLVAVPYDALEISEDGADIVLAQGSKEELEQLPEFQYEEE